jgi:two-component sensor histidine kinase
VNPADVVLAVHTEDIPLGVDAAISCGLIVN